MNRRNEEGGGSKKEEGRRTKELSSALGDPRLLRTQSDWNEFEDEK